MTVGTRLPQLSCELSVVGYWLIGRAADAPDYQLKNEKGARVTYRHRNAEKAGACLIRRTQQNSLS